MIQKKEVPALILRVSMALVFLYFGISQAYVPDSWAGYVPTMLTGQVLTANNWVMINALLEVALGLFLLLGMYTSITALILSLHLAVVALSIGVNPLGVRDIGLALATFVVFLNGPDAYSIDHKVSKKLTNKGN